MANFDSKQKRFSGLGLLGWEAPLLPDPTGSFDAGDRMHLLDLYAGTLGGAAAFKVALAAKRNVILGAGNP